MLRAFSVIFTLLFLAGCEEKAQSLDEFQTTPLMLPGGQEIRVEVLSKKDDMMRGMMFRDSLAPDRGVLFAYGGQSMSPFWMYQVRIPLDIIWLDMSKQVVEISPNTPPCKSASAKECPSYGGHKMAVYVLELPGGSGERLGIHVGDRMKF
jgi:uncharacterized protein